MRLLSSSFVTVVPRLSAFGFLDRPSTIVFDQRASHRVPRLLRDPVFYHVVGCGHTSVDVDSDGLVDLGPGVLNAAAYHGGNSPCSRKNAHPAGNRPSLSPCLTGHSAPGGVDSNLITRQSCRHRA